MMQILKSWIKASRVPAQGFIFPSLLLGQAVYYSLYGTFSWKAFVLIHLYGLFMHLFIVYANDYADYETDLINRTYTPFSGGSRALVEGGLTRRQLLTGAVIMSLLTVGTGIWLSINSFNVSITIYVLAGMMLLYAYSFEPVILSYRGFGEILQVAGVGVVLPVIGYLAHGGYLNTFPPGIILALLPAQMAMAVSTSLPDEPSDRMSSKRTSVVLLGGFRAKILIILLYLTTFILLTARQSISLRMIMMQFYPLLIAAFILSLIILSVMFRVKPGSKPMFYFVLLSILTNTSFSLWMIYYLFTAGK